VALQAGTSCKLLQQLRRRQLQQQVLQQVTLCSLVLRRVVHTDRVIQVFLQADQVQLPLPLQQLLQVRLS
jgi:hypothetical protein